MSHSRSASAMAVGSSESATRMDVARRSFSRCVEEFDLEGSILNAAPLADQLVEPLIIRSSPPLAVNVASVGCASRLAVDKDPKLDRSGSFGRSHDEVDVTGMKAKGDTPVRLVENRCPSRDRPKSG